MSYYLEDTFVEELVVRRNNILTLLIDAGIVILGLVVAAAIFLFLPAIFPAMLVICLFGIVMGIKFQGVEYEYSFTNGELDVDKIMAKRKRKSLVSINHKSIQVMAPYTKEYEDVTRDYKVSKLVDASSSKNAAGRWFFIFEEEDGTYTFVAFQPSRHFCEAMQKYLRSRIKGLEK